MWFKSRKPFTAEELHAKAAKSIRKPLLPDGYNEVLVTWISKTGSSFLDRWRKVFCQQLDRIASSKTWDEQRAHTIEIILQEQEWIALSHAAKEARLIESWSHIVKANISFSRIEKHHWQLLLHLRFWLAAISAACLSEIGFKLFKFDRLKENEINMFYEYVKETMMLHIRFQEMKFKAIIEHEDDKAEYIADIIDDQVNPILNNQSEVLGLMYDQIIYGNLDIVDIKKRMDAIDETKKKISDQLSRSTSTISIVTTILAYLDQVDPILTGVETAPESKKSKQSFLAGCRFGEMIDEAYCNDDKRTTAIIKVRSQSQPRPL